MGPQRIARAAQKMCQGVPAGAGRPAFDAGDHGLGRARAASEFPLSKTFGSARRHDQVGRGDGGHQVMIAKKLSL